MARRIARWALACSVGIACLACTPTTTTSPGVATDVDSAKSFTVVAVPEATHVEVGSPAVEPALPPSFAHRARHWATSHLLSLLVAAFFLAWALDVRAARRRAP